MTTQNKTRFWNRVQLILVLLLFAAPIVGAWISINYARPSMLNNYGELITPARPVANLTLRGVNETETIEMDQMRRQWIMLVVAKGACDQACEDNLLKIRQLRHMQGKNMSRMRSVFLSTQIDPAISADLIKKYSIEGYQVALGDFDDWTQVLKLDDTPEQAQENRIYMIDPAGNLMMSYPESADPNLMKKDIKRLLKTSQIG